MKIFLLLIVTSILLFFNNVWANNSCSRENTVQIAVAANFATTLDTLSQKFTEQMHYCIEKNVSSTTVLYNQIINGAPYDIYLSADAIMPSLLIKKGLVLPKQRITYAIGQLVLVAPYQSQVNSQLLQKNNITLAISNPALAPYGQAAKQVLIHLQLWSHFKEKVIMANDVSQVLTYLVQGGIEAGFISLAQVKYLQQHGKNKMVVNDYWLVPQQLYQPILQQAVVLKHGENNKAALAFFAYLSSTEARKIISTAGYTVQNLN
ncbi:molybdate ABC transporter substrate-binding protein [soil metagenome]